ncbi:MAG: ribosome recycling factor [Patescibacteria group bacterium]|jgi:ribosome recycling factor
MNQYLQAKQGDFSKALEYFKREISSLRTGRANPAVLDAVQVEAYDTLNPLSAVGNISVADAKSIVIVPWDKAVAKNIEKAIIAADLGLGVINEGDRLRLTVPVLTEENRRALVKTLNERLERSRINLRQVRDEIKNDIERAEEAGEISEDERFKAIKELDEYSAKQNDELKEIRDRKEQDIMEI